MATSAEKLGRILSVQPSYLEALEASMTKFGMKGGTLDRVNGNNEAGVRKLLAKLGVQEDASAPAVRSALERLIKDNEEKLMAFLNTVPGDTEFHKAANLATQISQVGKGFFLKKEYGKDIIRKCKPEKLLAFLGYKDVEELLAKHDIAEIFSALRFIESEEWMHETFEKAYSGFTAADFEERDIEIKVLGPEWHEVAKRFVAKKHHNVSHLKEFGVIFLNPIKEDVRGKFVRDFALLFHYLHEIDFYSALFRKNANLPDFATRLKALLRGDVPEKKSVEEGEWLIVQRYLFKIDPQDPRLFLPRVNPESIHWFRGERDLVRLGKEHEELDFELWDNLDWVGQIFSGDGDSVVSFDLEDNAMTEVAAVEGKSEVLNYHQREAMWTRLFIEYVGGETEMERLLEENFDKGVISLRK